MVKGLGIRGLGLKVRDYGNNELVVKGLRIQGLGVRGFRHI